MKPQLPEHFQLQRQAGSGGMATVYQALDLRTNQTVAIKCVAIKKDSDRERFAREIEILQADLHPCFVRCFSHGLDEDLWYAVLEWVEGQELSAILQKSALPIRDALILVQRIAEALSLLHQRGFIHRDIKPGNILLEHGDVHSVRLFDLGVAFHTKGKRLTNVGLVVGTPGYLSPEQARAEANPTTKADIFSLGALLYACLTGQNAFRGNSPLALLVKVLVEEPAPMRSLRPEIPEELLALTAQMLAKIPEERPSAEEVSSRILAMLSGDLEDHATIALPAPHLEESNIQPSALTAQERRLFCLLLLSRAVAVSTADNLEEKTIQSDEVPVWGELERGVSYYGGQLHWLADGSIAITFEGVGAALDVSLQAARCASELRRRFPTTPISLSMERAQQDLDLGAAIDRAAALLDAAALYEGSGLAIRVDGVAAGLLDARFVMRGDDAGLYLDEARIPSLQARTLLGKETPFVGRAKELELLSQTFDAVVAESKPRAMLLSAPSGIGKSRVARELLSRLSQQPSPPALWVGYADAANTPFRLLTSSLRRELNPNDSIPVYQAKFVARISRFVPKQHALRIATFIAQMMPGKLSLKHPTLQAAQQDPQFYADQLLRAFLEWISAEASEQPIVWILDDLQWADLPSLRFIERALSQLRQPIFLVGLIRPEDAGRLAPHLTLWEQIELSPIARRHAERLVRDVLGESISQQDLLLMVERAQGDAFFLEELMRAFAEHQGDTLPETLLAVTQSRLEALPEAERRALRAASIFGERFSREAIHFLLGSASDDPIDALLHKELIVASWQEERSFTFRQDLLQRAAYQMLTDDDKARGHQMAAQWLIHRGEDEASVIAAHLEKGDQPTEASSWYQRAAEQSRNAGDIAACLSFVKRAFDCGANEKVRGFLRALEVDAFFWSSQPLKIEASAREAMSLLPREHIERVRVIATRLMVEVQRGGSSQITDFITELQEIKPRAEERATFIRATALILPALYVSGVYHEANSFLQYLLSLAAIAAAPKPGLLLLAQSFREAFATANPFMHLRYAELASAQWKEDEDRRARVMSTVEWGRALLCIGQAKQAIEKFETAQRLADQLGATFVSSMAKPMWATALSQMGKTAEAEALAREAALELSQRGNKALEATARARLAEILLSQAKIQDAIEEATLAVERARRAPSYQAHALAVLARAYAQAGESTAALHAATEAAALQGQLGAIAYSSATIDLSLVEALVIARDAAATRRTLDKAVQRLQARAALIEDPKYKSAFLLNIPEHQTLLSMANK